MSGIRFRAKGKMLSLFHFQMVMRENLKASWLGNPSGFYEFHCQINRIYDGVEAETRKSQVSFQII